MGFLESGAYLEQMGGLENKVHRGPKASLGWLDCQVSKETREKRGKMAGKVPLVFRDRGATQGKKGLSDHLGLQGHQETRGREDLLVQLARVGSRAFLEYLEILGLQAKMANRDPQDHQAPWVPLVKGERGASLEKEGLLGFLVLMDQEERPVLPVLMVLGVCQEKKDQRVMLDLQA